MYQISIFFLFWYKITLDSKIIQKTLFKIVFYFFDLSKMW